jgi:hypothetical protein
MRTARMTLGEDMPYSAWLDKGCSARQGRWRGGALGRLLGAVQQAGLNRLSDAEQQLAPRFERLAARPVQHRSGRLVQHDTAAPWPRYRRGCWDRFRKPNRAGHRLLNDGLRWPLNAGLSAALNRCSADPANTSSRATCSRTLQSGRGRAPIGPPVPAPVARLESPPSEPVSRGRFREVTEVVNGRSGSSMTTLVKGFVSQLFSKATGTLDTPSQPSTRPS